MNMKTEKKTHTTNQPQSYNVGEPNTTLYDDEENSERIQRLKKRSQSQPRGPIRSDSPFNDPRYRSKSQRRRSPSYHQSIGRSKSQYRRSPSLDYSRSKSQRRRSPSYHYTERSKSQRRPLSDRDYPRSKSQHRRSPTSYDYPRSKSQHRRSSLSPDFSRAKSQSRRPPSIPHFSRRSKSQPRRSSYHDRSRVMSSRDFTPFAEDDINVGTRAGEGLRRYDPYKAKVVTFYKNGDVYYPGCEYRFIPGKDALDLEMLLNRINSKLDMTTPPHYVFNMDGDKITHLDEIEDGGSYVCSTDKKFKVKQSN